MKKKTIISALFASVILAMTCAMQYVNAANDSDGKNRIRVFLKNGVTVDFNEDEVDSITTNVASNGTVVEQNFWRNGSCRAFEADKIDSICYYKPTLELSASELEFGRVERGAKMRKSISITNTGKYPAVYRIGDIFSGEISTEVAEQDIVINAGETKDIEFTFFADPQLTYYREEYNVKIYSDNLPDGMVRVSVGGDLIEPIPEETTQQQSESVADIVNNSVDDNFNAAEQIAEHKEEIEQMESVNEVNVGDAATEVTYTNGEHVIYPYSYPSPFEYDRGTAGTVTGDYETVEDEFAKPMRKVRGNGKRAAVFNLFAGDPARTTQNEMVDQAISTLKEYYGDNNVVVYDQGSGGRWFSTWQIQATFESNDFETIYVSSLGSNDGRQISTLETNFIEKNKDFSWFWLAPNSTMYNAALPVNVNDLLARASKPSTRKLIYFASCNTLNDAMYLENSFRGSKDCIIGWSAPNVYGQAYAEVLFEYVFNLGKYASTFIKEAGNKKDKKGNPYIEDPNTDAKLRIIGDFKASGMSTRFTRMQINGNDEGLCQITKPKKTCDIDFWYFSNSDDYTLKAEIEDIPWHYGMTGDKNYYKNRSYFFRLNGGVKVPDDVDVTDIKRKVTFYPGVKFVELYSAKMTEREMQSKDRFTGDEQRWDFEDYKFLIINNETNRNDEQDAPVQVEMTAAANLSGKLYGIGKTVYVDTDKQKRGFEYWKKGTSDTKTVYADMGSESYFAELTGVESNTDYVVRAFAQDQVGNIRYSDNTVEVNSGEIEGSADVGGSENGHEYVDLGLSVKWATCNVGANSPEESGGYYAWAETEEKDWYDSNTHKYHKNAKESKYGSADGKTVLEPMDDAAHVNWGGAWRMPSRGEFEELCNDCLWTWTTINGVNGYTVTSKINGNSIFLPATGTKHCGELMWGNEIGYYWSNTLNYEREDKADRLWFSNDYGKGVACDYRYIDGNTVRPVLASKQQDDAYEFVDLDLPSGTLWATCNIGAASPKDGGDLFAWGETSTKSYYGRDNYKFYDCDNKVTKYCSDGNNGIVDNKTSLDPQDDAAYVLWGDNWRIPSVAQTEELEKYTTVENDFQNKCIRLISTRNGKSITLPYGDYWLKEAWDSSIANSKMAHYMRIYGWEQTDYIFDTAMSQKHYGNKIRPVKKK